MDDPVQSRQASLRPEYAQSSRVRCGLANQLLYVHHMLMKADLLACLNSATYFIIQRYMLIWLM